MAYKYLTHEIKTRSFSEELRKIYPGSDLKARLVYELSGYSPEISRAAVLRRVNSWLSDEFLPADRESYFQICFALNLNEKSADQLLLMNSENRIHYRNPTELIYAFCLKNHLTYQKSKQLISDVDCMVYKEKYNIDKRDIKTVVVRSDFDRIQNEQDLIAFIRENLDLFGSLHNTAYQKFKKMFGILQHPDENDCFTDKSDPPMSIEDTVKNYLRFKIPDYPGKLNTNTLSKLFKKHWPSPSSIKKICAGTEDVPRKVLLLLYIALDGVYSDDYDELDEDYISARERFDEHYWRINLMLDECGMCLIDPRNPFDWAILFTLKTDDENLMSDRMNYITEIVFGGDKANQKEKL